MEPIRIAYQSYVNESQAGTYWKHLRTHYDDIIDEGTIVDIKGIIAIDKRMPINGISHIILKLLAVKWALCVSPGNTTYSKRNKNKYFLNIFIN